jgi:hypothetical protein
MKLPCFSYTHWAHHKGKTGYEADLFIIHTHNELIKKKRQEIKLPCLSYTHWAHQKGKTGYEADLFIIHTLGSSKRKDRI